MTVDDYLQPDDAIKAPLIQLQSKDHEEILNVIDQLRLEGVSKYVNLPQLIVCGDQSSGKSSVLEAISGLGFPRRDNICTRFATELILRRASESGVNASIHPDEDRSAADQERMRSFKSPSVALHQFEEIVSSAESAIGVGYGGRQFSKDVLRVEVSGPDQPHLTMVDLPGLYHAPDESQDEAGVEFVESLALSYIRNKRSVILAVISAKSDIALQKVTAFTRRVDPTGTRTLGIITKPDMLSKGSDMERSFLALAMNKRVSFRLGWHVLKNRSYEERHSSLEQRRDSEFKFLTAGIWTALHPSQVGIDELRPRLSSVLKDHIIHQLPGLIIETVRCCDDAKVSLRKLGQARQTIAEQRRYLLHGSEKFTTLLSGAISGTYSDPSFGDAMQEEGYERRLRAVIQNRLIDFSETLRERGEERRIIEDNFTAEEGEIRRSDFVDEVQQRLRRSRGRELPGMFNPLVIGDLFYLQSTPWEMIVTECIDEILEDVQKVVKYFARDVLDERTYKALLEHIISPELETIDQAVRSKTKELLRPQQSGHPITYNHYFTESVQKTRQDHLRKSIRDKLKEFFGTSYPVLPSLETTLKFQMNGLIAALGTQTEANMERFACSEAIDCMQAYYRVARKKFVDDFSNLAVEKCLLEPLSVIYSPHSVETQTDDMVGTIAAEDDSAKIERTQLEAKVSALERSLTQLHRLDRHNFAVTEKYDKAVPVSNEDGTQTPELSPETGESEDMPQPEESASASPQQETLFATSNEMAPSVHVENSDSSPITMIKSSKIKKKHPKTRIWEGMQGQ